eukprot:Nitzschia sp. Nitz4//scaffold174_size87051//20010//21237//NITZ4_005102-RA/size87051-augustus-gene-0.59-mRNA-1//1//CDS//3329538851//1905//frame0
MKQIVRRHIGRQLAEYYRQPSHKVVGKSPATETTNLSMLLGEWHWRRMLKGFYKEREGHWLTPVELFQPHFSRILADFCIESVLPSSELHIVEVGGGRGTNARLILNYLEQQKPDIYEGLTYTLVDSSPSLLEYQKTELSSTQHANRVQFQLTDLTDVAEKKTAMLPPSTTPTVLIGMEVLDNLPHDKVQAKTRKQMQQAEIQNKGGTSEEVFVPMKDPLILKTIEVVPTYIKQIPTWVPTVACGLLDHAIEQRPNLGVVLADFDWLPAPDLYGTESDRLTLWADGEPIVTDMDGHDHECYLMAPPHCDILYPTDFDKLGSYAKRRLAARKRQSTVEVYKQADFLAKHGDKHVRKTKSWLTGHTPLLHDFVNCSVLTISSKPNQ